MQTLSTSKWELLLIDDASDRDISEQIDMDWHPNSRCIREENVGIVHARLRGISESNAELLVFVDDDNVLNVDYLGSTLEIAKRHSTLGAWSGQVLPEFEVSPDQEIEAFLPLLGIRSLARDSWGNDPRWEHLPMGAGMCVRRDVAQRYRQQVLGNPLRLSIGHAGGRTSCHEDTDLAVTSFDVGLGVGLFRNLILIHLIPKRRLSESYLLQLAENGAAALVILKTARGLHVEDPPRGRLWWIEQLRYWAANPVQRKITSARWQGEKAGRATVADLMKKGKDINAPDEKQKPESYLPRQQPIRHAAELPL